MRSRLRSVDQLVTWLVIPLNCHVALHCTTSGRECNGRRTKVFRYDLSNTAVLRAQKTPTAATKQSIARITSVRLLGPRYQTVPLSHRTRVENIGLRVLSDLRSTAARIRIQINQKLLFAWYSSFVASARKCPNRSLFKLSKIKPICGEFLTVNRSIFPVKRWPNLANMIFRRTR